ncbi:Apolipoprotein L1 [Manis pentadactyla]|nr:Apolipoprotein L1 [Manis pentadactyla]
MASKSVLCRCRILKCSLVLVPGAVLSSEERIQGLDFQTLSCMLSGEAIRMIPGTITYKDVKTETDMRADLQRVHSASKSPFPPNVSSSEALTGLIYEAQEANLEQRDGIKCAHCSQVLLFIILEVILETTYDFSGRLETLPKTTHMLREVDFHLQGWDWTSNSQHTEGNQSFRESQQRSLPFTLPFTLWGSYKHLKVPGALWSRLQAAAMTLVPKPEGGCEML